MPYSPYVSRFAPSPTGPLHFGSLVAAVASYLDARAHNGRWLVRMDDIDPPREVAGAADNILDTLQAFGFVRDGEVVYQSGHHTAYQTALDVLIEQNHVYPCTCSRQEIVNQGINGLEGTVYPGTCREQSFIPAPAMPYSVRLKTADSQTIAFTDQLQGQQEQNLARDIGDFVIKRADGYWAYQLANVVDDAVMGVTHVVRGIDLLSSTPRQIYLQQLLNLPAIRYAHLPLVLGENNEKLAKSNGAEAVKPEGSVLWECLAFLNQHPPLSLRSSALPAIWQWAVSHWTLSAIRQ